MKLFRLIRGIFTSTDRYRPAFDEWGLIVAEAVATRGDCRRRRVGAVILDRDSRICGAGYNGTYVGRPGCLEGACPRAASGVLPGSSYDTGPGACIAVHAELNAILDVSDKHRLRKATLYVTAAPCDGCLKLMRNTQLYAVIWINDDAQVMRAVHPFLYTHRIEG